jgi:hypothetical protein
MTKGVCPQRAAGICEGTIEPRWEKERPASFMLTAHLNALPGSIINDFNAAAVQKGVIYKINP